MSRSYRKVRPAHSKVYSVAEIQGLFVVCRNTVSNWVGSGLKPSDGSVPQLFRGAELIRFHKARAARKRQDLRSGEFKCLACGNAVIPDISTVSLEPKEGRATLASATCCDCGANVMKLLGATECDKFKECLDTKAELARIDEYEVSLPACVGKDEGSQGDDWFTTNDRLIHDWQAYAGRYHPTTVQAHLVSIRDFEMFLVGMPFDKVKPKDVGAYRDHLVNLNAQPKEKGGLSNSTVRHRASHLAAFFKWLRGQDGYRRLSANIPDYFALPRSTSAQQLSHEPKPYPLLDEAWSMVEAMPEKTAIQRRDRAMVAFVFVSGFRAATLTALRFKHVDFEHKTVTQNAKEVPAKYGKSYRANWFPRTEDFQAVFLNWVQELRALGFGAQDALFPVAKNLVMQSPDADLVAPLRSSKSLQSAFALASERIDRSYTPHSARHTHKALGDQLCRTHEQRKAWSLNLGHSDEQITEKYYGKMSPARSSELIEALCSDQVFTDQENEFIIDYYEGRFQRGTDEYRLARRLAEKREKARGDYDVIESAGLS